MERRDDLALALAVLRRYLADDPALWHTEAFASVRRLVPSTWHGDSTGDDEEADASSDEEEAPPPSSQEDRFAEARTHASMAVEANDRADYAHALRCADVALEANPDSVRARRARAVALFRWLSRAFARAFFCASLGWAGGATVAAAARFGVIFTVPRRPAGTLAPLRRFAGPVAIVAARRPAGRCLDTGEAQ